MKRFLSIFLVVAILFSFASCSGKEDDSAAAPPVVEESTYSKDFKDSNGQTVFTVNVTVPQITENCDPQVMEYINGVAVDIFNDACDFAESNLETASSTPHTNGEPWSRTITFETTLLNTRYACFIINDTFSFYGDIPIMKTICFDIQKGTPCTLWDFAALAEDPQSYFDLFLEDNLKPVLPMRFHHSEYITDEVLDRLDEIVNPDNFYLTETGLGFYFDKSLVDDVLSGDFRIIFPWEELTGLFELPE